MPGQHARRGRLHANFLLLGVLLLLSLVGCGTDGASGNGISSSASTESGNISTPTSGAAQTPTVTTTATGFKVTSVNITVNPTSLSDAPCGSNVTVTYTATFNFPANNPGGQVTFAYTTDSGRDTSSPQTLTVPAGQGDTTYQFTWSGSLPQDHTQPGQGGVMVSAPNQVNSQLVGPSGACTSSSPSTPTVPTTPLQVLSAVVTGPSLSGLKCGSSVTVRYEVTFTLAPGNAGGQITFNYSTDNGQSNAGTKHITVAAGTTTVNSSFSWHGTLPVDHTAPGTGAVMVTAPNSVTSTGGTVTGQCS